MISAGRMGSCRASEGKCPVAGLAILSFAAMAIRCLPTRPTDRFPTQPLEVVKAIDKADKPQVMKRQACLAQRATTCRIAGSDDVRRAPAPGSGRRSVHLSGGRETWDSSRRRPVRSTHKAAATDSSRCRASSRRPWHCRQQIDDPPAGGAQPAAFNIRDEACHHLRPSPRQIFSPSGAHESLPQQLLTIRNFYEVMVGLITPGPDGRSAPSADALPAGTRIRPTARVAEQKSQA